MSNFLLTYGSWIWLGVLILCFIIEAFTLSLTTIWGALASIPLVFIARTSLPFRWQLLIFAVITVLLIIFTRPFAIKKLKNGNEKTNVNSLEGEEVLVTKTITKFEKGLAKGKNGIIWSATSENNEVIPENTMALISSIEGNTLILKTKGDKES